MLRFLSFQQLDYKRMQVKSDADMKEVLEKVSAIGKRHIGSW